MRSAERQTAATLDDLYRVEGKAELVRGKIVHLTPTGFRLGRVGARIFRSLRLHIRSQAAGA